MVSFLLPKLYINNFCRNLINVLDFSPKTVFVAVLHHPRKIYHPTQLLFVTRVARILFCNCFRYTTAEVVSVLKYLHLYSKDVHSILGAYVYRYRHIRDDMMYIKYTALDLLVGLRAQCNFAFGSFGTISSSEILNNGDTLT